LTGPINLFVNFPTLKDYGVEKLFVLENENIDSSQRNIAYLVHGEKASQVQAVAGIIFLIIRILAHTHLNRLSGASFIKTEGPPSHIHLREGSSVVKTGLGKGRSKVNPLPVGCH
jgi:hypothetical protein